MSPNIAAAAAGQAADLVLAEHERAIHDHAKGTCENIIAIGRHLVEARDHAGHGAWLSWIETKFGWSDQTARRYIHVYELSRDAKFNTLVDFALPVAALYQLAAPKTPETARQEIADRLAVGEKPTYAEVKETIARAKQPVEPEIGGAGDDDRQGHGESPTRRKRLSKLIPAKGYIDNIVRMVGDVLDNVPEGLEERHATAAEIDGFLAKLNNRFADSKADIARLCEIAADTGGPDIVAELRLCRVRGASRPSHEHAQSARPRR